MPMTASMPNTPAAFRSTEAPASRVSAVSEMTPPTTGTMLEMVNLAAFTVAASAPPEITPDRFRYPTKASRTTDRRMVISHFSRPPIRLSPSLPRAAQATLAATKA